MNWTAFAIFYTLFGFCLVVQTIGSEVDWKVTAIIREWWAEKLFFTVLMFGWFVLAILLLISAIRGRIEQ
jgi:hypothetical protein